MVQVTEEAQLSNPTPVSASTTDLASHSDLSVIQPIFSYHEFSVEVRDEGEPHTPPEIQAIVPFLLFLKPLLYRCTLREETARPTAQRDFGINQAPVGRDRPLSRIRARSSRRHRPPAPARWAQSSDAIPPPRPGGLPGRPPPQLRLRHFFRSSLPPQLSPGTGTVDGGSRAPGKLAAEWREQFASRGSEGASPASPGGRGPARASRRLSSPGVPRRCAPLSGRSPPPGQAARVWGPGRLWKPGDSGGPPASPNDTPTCLHRLKVQVVGLPPPLGAPHSDSHRLACGQNRKEASRPPRRCTKLGRGCAGCGTKRSRRGCREGGRRDTTRMGSTPPPRPTLVPTQRGRGREEPQPKGRAHSSAPLQTSAATTPSLLALQSMGPGEGWRWGLGSRGRGRRGGEGALPAAADGYQPPLGV
ncbi:basic salivary proline-rich protein 2-like [Zalophus californianus]|uniref:Basic salivary proline-rich protein 2-like n=1 Tax=Zalophus californianus TaxID=9704 RepID=A0A6P9FH79_ZALCA|nr:basic salivary proline-rich protein 2-like [Zalophus californianus]